MALQVGRIAKIWKIEDKGKYAVVDLSTSFRNKETGKYKTDFSEKFVRFVGQAYEVVKELQDGVRIRIEDFAVTNNWDKDKGVKYTNHTVLKISLLDDTPKLSEDTTEVDTEEDPF